MISISISDLRRQISGVAFDLDVSHRLSMTLKTCPKLVMRGSTGALQVILRIYQHQRPNSLAILYWMPPCSRFGQERSKPSTYPFYLLYV